LGQTMPDPIVLSGPRPGPRVLILGAVHGNEAAGPCAIEQFLAAPPPLLCGRVTCVAVANPPAYAAGTRWVDANLNRLFDEGTAAGSTAREARLAEALMPLMRDCDVLLDLHSTLKPAPPFIVVGREDAATLDFAQSTGVEEVIVETFVPRRPYHLSFLYAARHGAAAGVLECGQHADPQARGTAHAAILGVLAGQGMIDAQAPRPLQVLARVIDLLYNDEIASYAGRTEAPPHRTAYPAGAPIALRRDGTAVVYDHPTWVLFANNGVADGQAVGAEMFYVAQAHAGA